MAQLLSIDDALSGHLFMLQRCLTSHSLPIEPCNALAFSSISSSNNGHGIAWSIALSIRFRPLITPVIPPPLVRSVERPLLAPGTRFPVPDGARRPYATERLIGFLVYEVH